MVAGKTNILIQPQQQLKLIMQLAHEEEEATQVDLIPIFTK